jgi:phage host-nuclease inhibitor protein Gam
MTTNNPSFFDLVEEVEGAELEPRRNFEVLDYESANWCMVKAQGAELRMQRRKDFVTGYRARLDAWLESANAADMRTTERMAELLQPWTEKELARQKRQSVSLPTGTVGFRQAPDSIEVVDAEGVIAQLEGLGHGECIRIKKEVDKRALMAHVKAGGALPEGVELRAGERRFYLKVGE